MNNTAAVQFSGHLATVAGSLTKRGSGELRLATSQSVNLTVGGDLSLEAGTLTVQSSNTANAAFFGVGGQVTIANGASLQRGLGTEAWTLAVAGDWVDNGTFVAGNSTVTFDGEGNEQTIAGSSVTVFNRLTIDGVGSGAGSNSVVVIPATNLPTVAGTLTNNGTLKQTKIVAGNAEFLTIADGASPPVAKYRGVDLVTADALGSTTVTVSGNQEACPNALGYPAKRCFTISPSNAGGADITFYVTPAELHVGQSPNTLNIWRWTGSGTAWMQVTKSGSDSTCTNASNCYVTGTGVAVFGAFVLKDDDPTSVTLADFYAEQVANYVLLTWETASELNNVGFNLYRGTSPTEPDRQLNDLLIPSQSLGNPGGFTYTWEDRADLAPGTTYYYWVEDVDVNGVATRYGPVSVDFVSPSAVTLRGVEASPAAVSAALPLAGTLVALAGTLVALAGALAVRRRQG